MIFRSCTTGVSVLHYMNTTHAHSLGMHMHLKMPIALQLRDRWCARPDGVPC